MPDCSCTASRTARCKCCWPIPAARTSPRRTTAAWTIPKGEPDGDEDLLLAAQREFKEETGITAFGPFIPLRPIKQKGGKVVHAWAFAGDCDPEAITSNTFTLEWPPKSGKQREFPEIDRAEWFDLAAARTKIKAGQDGLIEELAGILQTS